MARIVEDASFERARNHIATLALSMYQIHGLPAPSSDELGSVVARAEASMSLHQLRHPESISASAIGQIDQFVLSVADAKRRPTNIYSADAARAAQGSGSGWDGTKRNHADPQNLSLSSARYRDSSSDGGTGGGTSDKSGSGARYDSMGSVEWATPRGLAITRSYALNNDMAWATKQPDLMRLGQPAIQALHEAKLKGDGYDKLHSPAHMNFDNPTIVAGAGFMKRNHLDYDEAAKAAARVYDHRSMTPEEKAKWRKAVGGVLHSDNDKSDDLHKADLRRTGSNIKKAHPEMTPDVDRALKRFGADKGSALKANLKADDKEAAAKNAASKNEDAAAKMAELFKKRKAAQGGPQPPH